MPVRLNEVIPLGRRASEYIAMFGLTNGEQRLKILDCGGGPSSFNAEMNQLGCRIVSVDPLYRFSKEKIRMRFEKTFEDIMTQTEKNKQDFVWEIIKSPDHLRETRKSATEIFLEDFEHGKIENRYIDDELPGLSFGNKEFDIALSSHFLFLYSHILDLNFHTKAITEMLRVAKEVRIFPLQDLSVKRSIHLDRLIEQFSKDGFRVEVVNACYEFQKGSNEYLRIS